MEAQILELGQGHRQQDQQHPQHAQTGDAQRTGEEGVRAWRAEVGGGEGRAEERVQEEDRGAENLNGGAVRHTVLEGPDTSGAPPVFRESRLKARKPDEFDGKRQGLEIFLRALQNYFESEPWTPDERKVHIALSYMTKGTAAMWATRQAKTVGDSSRGGICTIQEFEDKLREAFDDPDKAATARSKLRTLQQKGRPVEQYVVDFELLEYESELDMIALVDVFKAGLDERVWEECYRDRPMPQTLNEWKKSASIHDRAIRRQEEERSFRHQRGTRTFGRPADTAPPRRVYETPRTAPPVNTFRSTPAPAYQPRYTPPAFVAPVGNSTTNRNPNSGPVPMDIDRARQFNQGGYVRRPAVCFRCGQPGHRYAECTARMDIRVAHGAEETKSGSESGGEKEEPKKDKGKGKEKEAGPSGQGFRQVEGN